LCTYRILKWKHFYLIRIFVRAFFPFCPLYSLLPLYPLSSCPLFLYNTQRICTPPPQPDAHPNPSRRAATWIDRNFSFVFSCTLFVLRPYLLFVSIFLHSAFMPLVTTHNKNTHAPGGIQTRNPSKRSAADPRLRPLGHRDRRDSNPDRPVQIVIGKPYP
jgi:hypothetical protein